MNKIEGFLGKGPFRGSVVDFELKIWGDVARLDGRQIGANHGGEWILVSKVDCPDACASSDF
jgi:hypothetical protein